MKTIKDIPNLSNVTVLLRADLNVPVDKGVVRDDFRLRMTVPTIEFLRSRGAKVVVISHIETADEDGGPTLAPVIPRLAQLLGSAVKVDFIKNYRNAKATIDAMGGGDVVVLENLRINKGEKANDKAFAKELASLGDIYIDDAFAVAHREHASICAITDFLPSYAGPLLAREVVELGKAFTPKNPFLFILGGAKFDTKLPLVDKFLGLADQVFIGGALANDCFKALGYEIGASKVSATPVDLSAVVRNPKTLLPVDLIVERGGSKVVIGPQEVQSSDVIMDAGPKTVAMLADKVSNMAFVLWNGPLGNYEMGYEDGTIALAKVIAVETVRRRGSGGGSVSGINDGNVGELVSILGGGDTVASIARLGIEKDFSFVSTGGGAMLDYLANETLPAIEALDRSAV